MEQDISEIETAPAIQNAGESLDETAETVIPDSLQLDSLISTPVVATNVSKKRKFKVLRKSSATVATAQDISEGAKMCKKMCKEEIDLNLKFKRELHKLQIENMRKKEEREEEEHYLKLENIKKTNENLHRENERQELEHNLRVAQIKAKIAYYKSITKSKNIK